MKLDLSQLVGLAVLATVGWHLSGGKLPNVPVNVPDSTPTPLAVPSAELQAAVMPIKQLVANSPEKGQLGAFFGAVKAFVARPDSEMTTTSQVLALVKNSRVLMYAPGQTTLIPGLNDQVRAFLVSQIGEEEAPLDAVKRAKVVAAFGVLEWACS